MTLMHVTWGPSSTGIIVQPNIYLVSKRSGLGASSELLIKMSPLNSQNSQQQTNIGSKDRAKFSRSKINHQI